VQGLETKLPVPLEDENVTVPVGELPVTVAMHVVDEPVSTGEGEQETAVEEMATTVITKVPELAALLESPG
jgi:hypothetical protein